MFPVNFGEGRQCCGREDQFDRQLVAVINQLRGKEERKSALLLQTLILGKTGKR